MPIPDQKAEQIVKILRDHIFTMVGPQEKLHSDQGHNFESQILADLCKAFQITTYKSRITPYHPMGDGLLERINRTHLNMLCAYVEHAPAPFVCLPRNQALLHRPVSP